MNIEIVTPPSVEPVGLSEVKNFLRVSHEVDDALISDLISAARGHLESTLGRCFITQRLRERIDDWHVSGRWKPGYFILARPNVQQIHALRLRQLDDDWRTIDPAHYQLDPYSIPSRVLFGPSSDFPLQERVIAGIEIEFSAGFGASSDAVPANIRTAILHLVADRYEHREGDSEFIPHAVRSLIAPFLRVRL